jgi:hypothetical protein
LAAATGCAGRSSPTADPTTSSTPSTASASPTSPSDAAAADATTIVRQYFVVLDKLRTTASTPLTRIRSVATSAQLASETKLVRDERERHLHQVGATRIADLNVQAVDLSHKAQAVPTVTCAGM